MFGNIDDGNSKSKSMSRRGASEQKLPSRELAYS